MKTPRQKEIFDVISAKDKLIAELESQISNSAEAYKVAILEERNSMAADVQQKEKRIIELESKLESDKLVAEKREVQLREQHKLQLQDKEAEIERLRDYRLRLSTKMVGETLEQHCSIKFDEAQSMGLFPNATFVKDNQAVEGTKGDFIFRDYVDGEEYVSIMFEMKTRWMPQPPNIATTTFWKSSIKTVNVKIANMLCWFLCLSRTTSYITTGLLTRAIAIPR